MKVAIYARVSTGKQDHEMQLAELRQAALQRGYETHEYVDTGSGKRRARLPERERMMEDARLGKLDAVYVWRFDRFARSTRDLLDALENFDAWNVDFVSLRDGVDTSTSTGKLVFTIIAALAEFERNLIRERVQASVQTARNKGKKLGRPRRFVAMSKALELLETGISKRQVARRLGVPERTLRRALDRLRQKGAEKPDEETLEKQGDEDSQSPAAKPDDSDAPTTGQKKPANQLSAAAPVRPRIPGGGPNQETAARRGEV